MTHKQRVLELLRDGRPHTHHELYALGCVAHSRISDLRRDGHRIEQWRDGDNYVYRLLSAVTESSKAQAAGSPVSVPALNELASSNPTDGALVQHRDGDGQLVLHIPRSTYEDVAA